MSDLGVVGSASVVIDPDFTGFAESVRMKLMPLLQQMAAQVKGIDVAVKDLTKSLTASVTPAQSLNTALDGIDVADLAAVSASATTTAAALTDTAVAAEATNAALDAIDPGDLAQVTAAATTASGALGGTAAAAQTTDASIGKTAATAGVFGGAMKAAGIAAVAAVAGFAAVGVAGGIAIKAAVDFETAFTGVTKTVEGTTAELAAIRQGIIDMSKTLPATTTEIAAVAESAGALGIATPNILEFTKTMVDLGNTTNVTAEDAATAFAKIANVLGTPQDEFDRLGATLVDLGNKGASTEAEILSVANRVAAAGQVVGLTEQQVLGLSSTLANLGIRAEMGGSAIQKTFFDMQAAIDEGGESVAAFAKVAGMSSDQFVATFKQDALAALQAFTGGLGKLEQSGVSASGVLADLDIKEVRQVQTLLKLASAQEVFARDQAVANTAWEENSALVNEANKRYATFESQMKVLKNTMMDTARVVGESLLPPFLEMVKTLTTTLGPAFATLASTVGPVLTQLLGSLATAFAPIMTAFAPVLAVLGQQLKPIIDAIAPVLGQVATGFGEIAIALLEALGPAVLTLISAGFIPLVQQVLPVLVNLFKDPTFVDTVKQLALALADIAKAIVDTGLVGAIADLMRELALPAIGLFRDAIVAIRDVMNSEDFKNGIRVIREGIQGLTGDVNNNSGAIGINQQAVRESSEIWNGWAQSIQNEVIDPVVGSVQQLFEWIGNLGEPIGYFVDWVEQLIIWIGNLGEPIGYFIDWVEQLVIWVGNLGEPLGRFVDYLELIGEWVGNIGEPFGRFIDYLEVTLQFFSDIFQNIAKFIADASAKLQEFIGKVPDFMKNSEGGFKLPGFASGGLVPGPKGAPMPAIVHGGEFVIPADVVSGLSGGSAVPFMGAAPVASFTGDGGGGDTYVFQITVPQGTTDPQQFGTQVGNAAGDAFVRRANIKTAVRVSPSSAR